MEGALTGPEEVAFFEDEWRNPIFVEDILKVVDGFIAKDKLVNNGGGAPHTHTHEIRKRGNPAKSTC